jgi:hypothetical protein
MLCPMAGYGICGAEPSDFNTKETANNSLGLVSSHIREPHDDNLDR